MSTRQTGIDVGCGTGQATRSLAASGCSVAAVEPGEELAALARRRLAAFRNVAIETSAFGQFDDRHERLDALVAASSLHRGDPAIGWRRVKTGLATAGHRRGAG